MQNKPNFDKGQNKPNPLYKKDLRKFYTPSDNEKQTQNKANLRKAKMNVNSLITKDYRKKDDFAVRKNKANSKPISERPKMNVNLYVTKEYENETAFRLEQNKPKQSQFQTRSEFIPKGAEITTGELLGILKPGTNSNPMGIRGKYYPAGFTF